MPPAKRAPRKPVVRPSADAEVVVSASARRAVEAEALDAEWLVVPLAGVDVRVRPFMDWPRRVYDAAVSRGDLSRVVDVIHPDDVAVWVDGDATVRESFAWFEAVVRASGQDLGE